MSENSYTYFRGRWPDDIVPEGEPLWLLYEVDEAADNVLRSVEIFPNGQVTRNSVGLEQRNGDHCPSLIDVSRREGMAEAKLEKISADMFEELYQIGADTPFWFVR
ncbi:MAG: hypothetical protein E5W65_17365 [Mesorhizobium sp.]|uniref:hypothetical protein n=1 Tax=Mesorhizobium sp. TaxID=1871066 RepID=UPI001202BB29|nr:hypothetical protein [Mesorhizobium sp.]TIT34406.1 MAG: hypothetical protein E5W65_17365 [Mesorhizobium sp.]